MLYDELIYGVRLKRKSSVKIIVYKFTSGTITFNKMLQGRSLGLFNESINPVVTSEGVALFIIEVHYVFLCIFGTLTSCIQLNGKGEEQRYKLK